jgi:phosphoglycerate dehydrogenase-like enzyme
MVTLVVLTDGVKPPGMAVVEQLVPVNYVTAAELPEALPGAEILFVWDFRSDAVAAAWPNADALRWAHIASAGVDRLLFPELVRSPVVVTNSRGVFDQPMAEYVLGLVLTFAKDIATTVRLQRERRWKHRVTERLAGQRAVVVGTGPIGRAIGGQLAAAGLVVEVVGRAARWPEVIADADYVVLAAPLTEQTRGMVDARALNSMKSSARLINVGRGELVVEADLVAALRAGSVSGAALDVFEDEPLPDSSPLWDMPNVLVSPHMSGDTVGYFDELVALFLDNFRRYRNGEPLVNVVDKTLGYVR